MRIISRETLLHTSRISRMAVGLSIRCVVRPPFYPGARPGANDISSAVSGIIDHYLRINREEPEFEEKKTKRTKNFLDRLFAFPWPASVLLSRNPPTPDPSQEGSRRSSAAGRFSSRGRSGVGSLKPRIFGGGTAFPHRPFNTSAYKMLERDEPLLSNLRP